ncbi:MAG: ribosome silencing factor [Pseudomonadota bacterium]
MPDLEHNIAAIVAALEDGKAQDIKVIDVRGHTSMTDFMVIASGTSDRHVRSVAGNLVTEMKKAGERPLGIEGESDGEWVLVDLQDALVHVMLPRVRDFYNLEKLWDLPARAAAKDSDT